jgi:hypothetical protein
MSEKYLDDKSINQQWFAEEIARREGKTTEVDIGQIKEVLKITLEILASLSDEEVTGLLEKHK